MTVYRFTQAPMGASCYVIQNGDTDTGILIDPCVSPRIVFSQLGHSFRITHLLITHGHFDHIWTTDEWVEETGAELIISNDDACCLSSAFMNGSSSFYALPDVVCDSKADTLLSGEEELLLNDISVKVFSAPGHTPGGLLYLIGDHLFSGDTLFYRNYGRSDLPGGDRELLRETLISMGQFYGKGIYLCPGHGDVCRFDDAYITM